MQISPKHFVTDNTLTLASSHSKTGKSTIACVNKQSNFYYNSDCFDDFFSPARQSTQQEMIEKSERELKIIF